MNKMSFVLLLLTLITPSMDLPPSAPHCTSLRGHGVAPPPVRRPLGEDHCPGVWHGSVSALPGLHRVSHHHLEEEPHEVRDQGRKIHHLSRVRPGEPDPSPASS